MDTNLKPKPLISISTTALDGWQRLAERTAANSSQFGAVATFVGVMRDANEGASVQHLWVEH